MIKKLHYVWFGGKALPSSVVCCIKSWKKFCQDWEIIQWNENNFDTRQFVWVQEAIAAGKYAFAADFVRLWVLNKYGGGYIDTDVQVLRSLNESINNDFVCGVIVPHIVSEDAKFNRLSVQTGFIYSEPNHPFLKIALEKIYDNGLRHFVDENGVQALTPIDVELMDIMINHFGAELNNKTQVLADCISLYDSTIYATRKSKTSYSYLIHWFDQTWVDNKSLKIRIKKFIKRYCFFLYRLQ